MTQSVVNFGGSGYYQASSYGSTAGLVLGDDGDAIGCTVDWASNNYVTTHLYIRIRDGPVYPDQSLGGTGDPSSSIWVSRQFDLYENASTTDILPQQTLQNISLRASFPSLLTNFSTRIISCMAYGVDRATLLPVTITATSKLILDVQNNATTAKRVLVGNGTQPSEVEWQDFAYPLYENSCAAVGCISTIARDLNQPAWIAKGPAVNWPDYATEDGVLTVVAGAENSSRLWQVAPAFGYDDQEVVHENTEASVLQSFDAITGFGMTLDGRLYVMGREKNGANHVVTVASWDSASDDFEVGTSSSLGKGPPSAETSCVVADTQADLVSFWSLGGGWQHPVTQDVYVVDETCGFLYRLGASAFDGSCTPFGSCGQVHLLSDLNQTANFVVNNDNNNNNNSSGSGQTTSLTGDVRQGILYIAYPKQCGVEAFNLTTGVSLGWAVASKFETNGTFIDIPVCGYLGDGNLAVGASAALSSDLRQMVVDDVNGDLYIADTGNNVVRKVDYATKAITTVAGNGFGAYTGKASERNTNFRSRAFDLLFPPEKKGRWTIPWWLGGLFCVCRISGGFVGSSVCEPCISPSPFPSIVRNIREIFRDSSLPAMTDRDLYL